MKHFAVATLFSAVSLAPVIPVFAQDAGAKVAEVAPFDEKWAQARAKGIEGVTFTLDLGDKTQFHRGEAIPLKLRFSATPYNGYKLDSRAYDRSGRLNHTDFFVVDRPQDAPDPLREHFAEGAFMGGGLSGLPEPINGVVQEVAVTLNEHLRFDRPGRYRLFVLSKRAFKADGKRQFSAQRAVSDVVEFEILAGEEWAQERSREIAAQLAQAPAPKPGASTDEIERRNENVTSGLQFLDTPLSRRLMARYYEAPGFPYSRELRLGLLGTRDRPDAIQAIREQIQAPGAAVSEGMVRVLSELMFWESSPPALPPYPAKALPTSAERKAYDEASHARFQRRTESDAQARRVLEESLEAKRGQARALSLVALIGLVGKPSDLSTLHRQYLAREVVRSWDLVPLKKRQSLLSKRSVLARDAALLPLLRREMEREEDFKLPWEQRYWYGLLLQCIDEIDPSASRKYLQLEMARPRARVGIEALLDLPDDILPTLEKTWLQNIRAAEAGQLRDDVTHIARLIARYASPSIAPALREFLAQKRHRGNILWEAQAALLAYFVRVQPRQGVAMIEAEVAKGKSVALEEVAAFTMSSELEALCVRYLDHKDRGLAAQAAGALSQAGSAQSEGALWKRMERWHGNLAGTPLDPEQARFELALALALGRMPGPQLQAKQRVRLSELCVSPATRKYLEQGAGATPTGQAPAISVQRGSGEGTWQVGLAPRRFWSLQAVERKATQFPRGTTFEFRTWDAQQENQHDAARLGQKLRSRGYTVRPVTMNIIAQRGLMIF